MKNLKNKLPAINTFEVPRAESRIDKEILAKWNPNIRSAAKDENNVITIYEVIGEEYGYYDTYGFTAKRMAAALRSIGKKNDVIVSINSPGGDFFEGAAIYNLLREHQGNVTVQIIGMAASAASIIAMAGDEIQMSDIGFYMIHDVWSIVLGNRNELRKTADTLETFDNALIDVYEKRTGYDRDEIVKMLDDETWLNASDAVEKGFADKKMDDSVVDESGKDGEKKAKAMAKRYIEMALARDGLSRKDREEILNKAFGERDAADAAARDAGQEDEEKLRDLLNTIKGG